MVKDIVGDGSALALNDVADAAACGDAERLQIIFPKAIEAGNNADMILSGVLRHFQFLQLMKSRMEKNRQPASAVIASARPPIHFSRKDAVMRALSIWQPQRLSRAMNRLDTMMLECRKNNSASESIAGTCLLAIALEARAMMRR